MIGEESRWGRDGGNQYGRLDARNQTFPTFRAVDERMQSKWCRSTNDAVPDHRRTYQPNRVQNPELRVAVLPAPGGFRKELAGPGKD